MVTPLRSSTARLRALRVQVGFAFNRIESALSYLVNHLARFSGLAAQTERLDALFAGVCRSLALP